MKRLIISAVIAALLGVEQEHQLVSAVNVIASGGNSTLPPRQSSKIKKLAQINTKESLTTKMNELIDVKETSENKIEIQIGQFSKASQTETTGQESSTVTYAQTDPDVYGPNGDNYENNHAQYDFSRIGIDIKNKTSNPKCQEGYFMKAHWVGSLQSNGVVFENTYQGTTDVEAEPRQFFLGNYQQVQCLELAFQQLRPGEKAQITCPSFYAYGGAFTQSKVPGGQPLPLNADVQYDVEVFECNVDNISNVQKEDKPTSYALNGDRCFYLHAKQEISSTDLVLTCEDEAWVTDSHFKHYPGIHCYLEEYVKDNSNQQWYFDEKTGHIKDANHGFYLVNDHGILMLGDMDHLNFDDPYFDPWFPREKQKWEFCPYESILETYINGIKTWVGAVPSIGLRNELEFHPFAEQTTKDDLKNGIWNIDYC